MPSGVAKTQPLSCHAGPAFSRSSACRRRCSRRAGAVGRPRHRARAGRGLGADDQAQTGHIGDAAPNGKGLGVEVDVAQCNPRASPRRRPSVSASTARLRGAHPWQPVTRGLLQPLSNASSRWVPATEGPSADAATLRATSPCSLLGHVQCSTEDSASQAPRVGAVPAGLEPSKHGAHVGRVRSRARRTGPRRGTMYCVESQR